jgi:hypothetical protein
VNRRKKIWTLLLALSILLISSCTSTFELAGEEEREVELNLLTGLPGSNNRVIAVKIDDTRAAHPQVGLESADVVYIEQVEAGLTRLVAIYSSNYPVRIGPIRSARISDIDILAEYGRVGFIFSGAQSKMYPVIANANLANLGAQRNPPSVYVRDPLRSSPTNMFVYPEKLLEVDSNANSIDQVRAPGWTFGQNSGTGTPITRAEVRWPSARYAVSWSSEEDRWLIEFNGEPNFNEKGYQLGSPTFVIQIVNIYPSEFGDRYGGVTPKHEVIGEGRGYILRDGQAISALWNRPDAVTPTRWTLPDGSDAPFEPGQIWIALTKDEPAFEYPSEETKGKTQK